MIIVVTQRGENNEMNKKENNALTLGQIKRAVCRNFCMNRIPDRLDKNCLKCRVYHLQMNTPLNEVIIERRDK